MKTKNKFKISLHTSFIKKSYPNQNQLSPGYHFSNVRYTEFAGMANYPCRLRQSILMLYSILQFLKRNINLIYVCMSIIHHKIKYHQILNCNQVPSFLVYRHHFRRKVASARSVVTSEAHVVFCAVRVGKYVLMVFLTPTFFVACY